MKFIAVAVFFISHFALAQNSSLNLSGLWRGYGTWSYEGSGTNCHDMQMSWQHSETELTLVRGQFECDFVGMTIEKVSWKLENGNIIDQDGDITGKYEGNTYSILQQSPNPSTKILMQIKINRPTQYDYIEKWYNDKGPVYDIEARFFKP